MTKDLKLSTRYGLTGIGALALLSVVHWMRGLSNEWIPTVSYLLGVAPNILAAIAIPFVFMSIVADHKKDASPTSLRRWTFASLGMSLVGLIGWEFIQRTSDKLIFDVNDLGATLVGATLACAIFYVITPTRQIG